MDKKNILFVCLGNICRSPAAEGIFKTLVEKEGLENFIDADSAGTLAYHTGEGADERMKYHAANRGYSLTSIARKFDPSKDFENFDYILTMDNQNYNDINAMDINKKYKDKIFRMTDFNREIETSEVPDPYYDGPQGFENVMDILEDACKGLIDKIKNGSKQ